MFVWFELGELAQLNLKFGNKEVPIDLFLGSEVSWIVAVQGGEVLLGTGLEVGKPVGGDIGVLRVVGVDPGPCGVDRFVDQNIVDNCPRGCWKVAHWRVAGSKEGGKKGSSAVLEGLSKNVRKAPLSSNVCSIILTVHHVRQRFEKPFRKPLARPSGIRTRPSIIRLDHRYRRSRSGPWSGRHSGGPAHRDFWGALLREDHVRVRASCEMHAPG